MNTTDYEIFTDSCANLTETAIDKYGINVISLTIDLNEKTYLCYEKNKAIESAKFYSLLRQKANLKTESAKEETFLLAFREKLSEGKNILFIGFSSALSATFFAADSAMQKLKKEFPARKMFAVDTLAASLGEGLLVLSAAKLREEGATVEEARQWAEENKLKLCQYFTVDDLFFLCRDKHVKSYGFPIANILKIKPIMQVDDYGRLNTVYKVIGRKKSVYTLADRVAENICNANTQTLCIAHGDCVSDAILLKNRIIELVPDIREILINTLDPVIGAHSGPGTLAVFFLGGHR